MAVKIYDTMTTASDGFPLAYAEKINVKRQDGSEDNLQNLFNNGELGGGDNSVTITEQEYQVLTDEEKYNGLYYCYDVGKIYKNGVEYARSPIVTVVETEDGHNVAIEDVNGVQNFEVLNGKDCEVPIDDVNEPSETSVWSSKKTSDEIADIEDALKDKADKTELDGSKKLYITNTGANIKFVKIASAPTDGSSIDIHFKSARTNTTFEEETVRISKYISKTVYDGKIIQKSVYAANGNTPNESEANFLVTLDDYSVWAHIASYSTAEIELYSYGRKQSIDGTEATTLPSEVKYSMFNGAEIATMDKLGGLTFSVSGKTLTITNGTNTWTLVANS